MTFKEILNFYLKELNCSSKNLSEASKISESVISRYRSGKRTPKENSKQIKDIAKGIYVISQSNKVKYSKEDILKKLNQSVSNKNSFDYDNFSKNLNNLISTLNINTNDMSKYIVFDASHISRIRYGKTKPSDPNEFIKKVCNYVINKFNTDNDKKTILSLTECTESNENLYDTLFNWLINNKNEQEEASVSNFLNKLDEFNLNDYIKAIKFDELKVPTIPFYKARSKNYYGLEEMKKAELDFFKATVLSKSKEDIFMCSDMPMEDMAKDADFGKKWMFGVAMSLKKGLNLNIIHNIDRPFNEMMLGLESWVPIYMTGQISPYYIKDKKNSIYEHINYTSGSAILTGECIKGYHSKGKYYVTSNAKEIKYYKEKANLILKKANPLMEIYKEEKSEKYKEFLINSIKINKERKRILSSLPLFTISDELLLKILKRCKVSKKDIESIISYKNNESENIKSILDKNKINDNIFNVSKNDILEGDISLSLENMFFSKKISYSYEEYLEHLKLTKKFAKENKNYNLIINNYKTFNNINITIIKDSLVILSKSSNPTIHFVIKHPKLTDAISNFEPIVEE